MIGDWFIFTSTVIYQIIFIKFCVVFLNFICFFQFLFKTFFSIIYTIDTKRWTYVLIKTKKRNSKNKQTKEWRNKTHKIYYYLLSISYFDDWLITLYILSSIYLENKFRNRFVYILLSSSISAAVDHLYVSNGSDILRMSMDIDEGNNIESIYHKVSSFYFKLSFRCSRREA